MATIIIYEAGAEVEERCETVEVKELEVLEAPSYDCLQSEIAYLRQKVESLERAESDE